MKMVRKNSFNFLAIFAFALVCYLSSVSAIVVDPCSIDSISGPINSVHVKGEVNVSWNYTGGCSTFSVFLVDSEGNNAIEDTTSSNTYSFNGSIVSDGEYHFMIVDSSNAFNESEDLFIIDNHGPVLTLPSDMVIDANDSRGNVVDFSVSANDTIEGSKSVSCYNSTSIVYSGDYFPIQPVNVTCESSDSLGNTNSGFFQIWVKDLSNPVLTLGQWYHKGQVDEQLITEIVAEATSASGAIVNFTAEAYDTVDGYLNVTCDMMPGSLFVYSPPSEDTIVMCSAQDDAGNKAEDGITITVQDTSAPIVTINGGNILLIQRGSNYTDLGATSYDLVDGDLTSQIEVDDQVNSSKNGQYNVVYTSLDFLGNGVDSIRKVYVGDYNLNAASLAIKFENISSSSNFSLNTSQSSSTTKNTSGFLIGGNFFEIQSNLVNGEFNVTLTFNYADTDNNGIVDGTTINESNLSVYFYNTSSSSWQNITNPTRDLINNKITVNVNHFTLFSLMTVAPVVPPKPGNGNGGGGGGGSGGNGNGKNNTKDKDNKSNNGNGQNKTDNESKSKEEKEKGNDDKGKTNQATNGNDIGKISRNSITGAAVSGQGFSLGSTAIITSCIIVLFVSLAYIAVKRKRRKKSNLVEIVQYNDTHNNFVQTSI